MNRYVAYMLITNMLGNILFYVPLVLLEHRMDGAVLSVVLASLLGTGLFYVFTKSLAAFPQRSVAEIFEQAFSKSWNYVLLPVLSLFWFSAGIISILSFTNLNIRFFNPELPPTASLVLFLVFVCLITLMPSPKILFFVEIMLIITAPFILFIFYKTVSNDQISWDSVLVVLKSWDHAPDFASIAAATYAFSGYVNLVVFHKYLKPKVKLWAVFGLLAVGLLNLATTFLMPIGYHGVDGVEQLTYPWLTTADSIQMEYGFVERTIYPFLLLFMIVSTVSIVIHWHVGVKLLQAVVPQKAKHTIALTALVLSSVAAITWMLLGSDIDLAIVGERWLNFRLVAELSFVGLIVLAAARRKKHGAKDKATA
ncbi:GerAB/ArcD/ProY family transporter [Paenibacillus sp. TRM 82003]|nr:GerAB/ArcD/ProY family transporter [Paenibacillus sp. TRM 82003]